MAGIAAADTGRGWAAGALACVLALPAAAAGPDFDRDVRPVLADHCFACHGPDASRRKAGLRLDRREDVFRARSGEAAVVPGSPDGSLLWARVRSQTAPDAMPPRKFGKPLSAEQLRLLRRWIECGAPWQDHWAYQAPRRPPPPTVRDAAWPRNAVDFFVLARLERAGLRPAPEADRATLIRRVSLDLTGLPPSPDEVDAFLADTGPDAYEKVVERLLASPHYGERMAQEWLDLARYADTNGYHADTPRELWKWRDWVIDAFNRNLPFDRFTVEQLAGDLLAGATREQRVATGFHRNHMISAEPGADPAEYRLKYVADRVATTATVWLGSTLACAECHDHKYDPFTQKDFYRLAAFFNNVDELGLDGLEENPGPALECPTPQHAAELAAVRRAVAEQAAALRGPLPALDGEQAGWEAQARRRLPGPPAAAGWTILRPERFASLGGADLTRLADDSLLASGPSPANDVYEVVAHTTATGITAIRLEALADPSLSGGGPGRRETGNFVLTEFEAEAAPAGAPEQFQALHFQRAEADHEQLHFGAGRAIDNDSQTGWAVGGAAPHRQIVFVARTPFGSPGGTALRFRLRHESILARHCLGRFRLALTTASAPSARSPARGLGPWRVSGPFTSEDGGDAHTTEFPPERGADAVPWVERAEWEDGATYTLPGGPAAFYLRRAVRAPLPQSVRLTLDTRARCKVWVNGKLVREETAADGPVVIDADLHEGENDWVIKLVGGDGPLTFRASFSVSGHADALAEALATPAEARASAQRADLRALFRTNHPCPELARRREELARLHERAKALRAAIPTTPVMRELPRPRDTFVLVRGDFQRPGEAVTPATPACLPPLPKGVKADRLALARWLVAPDNPLVSRVTVNRYWAQYFGTGLVKSVEDFGSQGERPSHPELLDWLAVEFREGGWDVKAMQRLIVLSATYRQAPDAGPELLRRDPDNRLLARGPRFRLSAEAIRDQALAASGLLRRRVGGPSAKPYQPPGLWEPVGGQPYVPDSGANLYRRSLYTYWKRSVPPPGLTAFDAPSREVCTARRERTNTPLQALVLLNDTTYVEAARALGQRALREAGPGDAERLSYAFRLCLVRRPTPEELRVLLDTLRRQRESFRRDPEAARLLLGAGQAPAPPGVSSEELAAWAAVGNVLLNLAEVLTKG
jgi:hypothetical protein